jgi:hypothetical protein
MFGAASDMLPSYHSPASSQAGRRLSIIVHAADPEAACGGDIPVLLLTKKFMGE